MTPRANRVAPRATATSPRTKSTTDAPELRGLLPALEQLGFDVDGLLTAVGLQRADVQDPDVYVAPAACAGIFVRALQERRVRNLALQLARRTPVIAPLPDYLLVSADSVGHGLQRLARYFRLYNGKVIVTIADEDPLRVIIDSGGDPFYAELAVASSLLRFIRETDDQLRAAHVTFAHEPDDVSEYAAVLQCSIRTCGSWNGWALPKEASQLPLRRRDPALGRWLERQATRLLATLPTGDDITSEVRHALATQVTSGATNIEPVARRLATTRRTLQRRLAETGTSFEAIRDDVRRRAAEMYLADRTLSVTDIAYLLGYAEPTSFHRAFKRWHGTTPEAFRERAS
jgi:AraC-like DNA-binding protein